MSTHVIRPLSLVFFFWLTFCFVLGGKVFLSVLCIENIFSQPQVCIFALLMISLNKPNIGFFTIVVIISCVLIKIYLFN